jgi:hypothetical protein
LSARVRQEIAAEPASGRFGWRWSGAGLRGLVPFAAAAALVIAVFSGISLVRAVRGAHAPAPVVSERTERAVPPAAAPDGRALATPDAENAEVWAVLSAAASSVKFEDAHDAGMHVHPAAIDHAVQELSAAELTELGKLLQTELKRSSN